MIAAKTMMGTIGVIRDADGELSRLVRTPAEIPNAEAIVVKIVKGSTVADDAYPEPVMEHLVARKVLLAEGESSVDLTTMDEVMSDGEKVGDVETGAASGPVDALDNEFGAH